MAKLARLQKRRLRDADDPHALFGKERQYPVIQYPVIEQVGPRSTGRRSDLDRSRSLLIVPWLRQAQARLSNNDKFLAEYQCPIYRLTINPGGGNDT